MTMKALHVKSSQAWQPASSPSHGARRLRRLGSSSGGGSAGTSRSAPCTRSPAALAGAGGLMNNGAEMAVEDINDAGGIKVSTAPSSSSPTGDSQGKAAIGQSEAQRLIQDGAVALVGTYQSDVTQNVAAVAERARVPLVIDVAVDDQILEQGYKNTFRIQPNATSMGTDGAEALHRDGRGERQPRRVGLLHPHRGLVRPERLRRLQGGGRRARASRWSRRSSTPATNFTDATTQVREAAAANPDAIVATGYYPDSLLIAKSVKRAQPRHQRALRHRQRRLRRRLVPR